jgi:PncC family amidohydrolase
MISKATGNKISKYLLLRSETIAVAESVTSGVLQQMFSDMAEAEHFYQGGITTYNVGQKYRHLQVEPIHALSCNCVSAKVAEQMALNVCDLFNSDWGISTTGYSAPVRESGNKRFCYYSICYKGVVRAAGRTEAAKMTPAKAQEVYAQAVIDEFIRLVDTEGRA